MDKVILQKHYDVLKSPVITEKATLVAASNQIAFEVNLDATKAEIKEAIEAIYKVKVESVNTVNIGGKSKRFKGVRGVRNNVRKAYVKLAKDAKIDVMAGV
jgi:large subunit ribosomal protein L23